MPAFVPELIPAAGVDVAIDVGIALVVFGLRGLWGESVRIFESTEPLEVLTCPVSVTLRSM